MCRKIRIGYWCASCTVGVEGSTEFRIVQEHTPPCDEPEVQFDYELRCTMCEKCGKELKELRKAERQAKNDSR